MTEEQRQLCIDFQTLFDTEQGKRVLGALVEFSTYEQRYTPGVHPSVTWSDLGKREFFLFIKDKLEADTSELAQQSVAITDEGVNKEGQQQEKAEDE